MEGFERLKKLDISGNRFNKSILSSLGALTSLNTLILSSSFDSRDSSFPIQELKNFKNLTFLDISDNSFNGTLSFKEFSTFKRLETLNLEDNAFTGYILEDMWAPLSLKALYLYGNKFSGSFSKQSLCSLKDLQHLDLSYNEFGGTLPRCLGNLTSFTILDLSGNQLAGYLPSFWPPKLQYVDLSHNHLEGVFSSNYSSLENGWIPSFQLRTLIMQDCGLESIPEFLFHQFKSEVLDLSHNKLKGRFPYWLLHNNGGLEILNFMNNSFNGQLEIEAKMLSSMTYLNLARNHFEALFNLTRIADLQLNDNKFEGTYQVYSPILVIKAMTQKCYIGATINCTVRFLTGWVNITGLEYLNLRDNLFQGQISCQLLSTGIKYLDLSYNSLSGLLPSCFNGNSLQQINLQGNRFSGSIPETLVNISTLNSLDLNDNELSGTILNKPGENLSGLRVLLLCGNHFSGFIPNWMCQLNIVSLLDLLKNSFFGSIPHCLYNLSFGREGEGPLYGPFSDKLVEWGIGYWGSSEILLDNTASFDAEVDEESEFVTKYRAHTYKNKALNYMSGLDLSDNNLTGEIPYELGALSHMKGIHFFVELK
ncbi:receptor like protein 21-like [Manihot esculenta]|uniref:receptor like protein 21-like n=1 Tax=Manihot esculenta TaxID=3983 RepID=UPI001CC4FBA8|nr:receptor like protein 21-like [Manihot esculenta]